MCIRDSRGPKALPDLRQRPYRDRHFPTPGVIHVDCAACTRPIANRVDHECAHRRRPACPAVRAGGGSTVISQVLRGADRNAGAATQFRTAGGRGRRGGGQAVDGLSRLPGLHGQRRVHAPGAQPRHCLGHPRPDVGGLPGDRDGRRRRAVQAGPRRGGRQGWPHPRRRGLRPARRRRLLHDRRRVRPADPEEGEQGCRRHHQRRHLLGLWRPAGGASQPNEGGRGGRRRLRRTDRQPAGLSNERGQPDGDHRALPDVQGAASAGQPAAAAVRLRRPHSRQLPAPRSLRRGPVRHGLGRRGAPGGVLPLPPRLQGAEHLPQLPDPEVEWRHAVADRSRAWLRRLRRIRLVAGWPRQPRRKGRTGVSPRIVVDPITRIEGHLRIEAQVDGGMVQDAWSSTTMWRGLEQILIGRDPRDAWYFAQRICGVCTTVHALASIRAVEDALDITPPLNARLLRDLIGVSQYVHDHVVHFYHLHALDWVDVVSALKADPQQAAVVAQSLSDYPRNTAKQMTAVQQRLQAFVQGGRLGPFANGYWGHPAYKLSPEVNLLAVSHYLDALDFQRDYVKIHALLGGKNPHPQTYVVGGMAIPIDPNSQYAINDNTLQQVRGLLQSGLNFVNQAYIPDLVAIGKSYPEWTAIGGGLNSYMTFGDFGGAQPKRGQTDTAGILPSGIVRNGDLSKVEPVDPMKITEDVARGWYSYREGDG